MSTTNMDTEMTTQNKVKTLPPFKVILHNDDVNQAVDVVKRILEFTPLEEGEALNRTIEAHDTGQAVLMVCHRERAELVQEQFGACHPIIIVTVEADA